MPATFKGFGHRAAQEKPTDGGGQYHERKGYRQEVEGDERRDREAYEKVVVDGALGDPQDSLDDDGYHHWLDPVQKPRDHRHVGVGYSQVREEPQHEDGGDHEERAGHDPPYRPVQPPTDVGGHLLGLRARKEHAEVERPQVLALGDPPFPLDQLAVHDGDLARRSPEVDKTKLHPEPEGLPEAYRLGLPGSVLPHSLGIHAISTTLVNNTGHCRVTTVTQEVKSPIHLSAWKEGSENFALRRFFQARLALMVIVAKGSCENPELVSTLRQWPVARAHRL